MERANGWQDSGATYAYPEPITKSDGESSGFTCDTLTPGEISVGRLNAVDSMREGRQSCCKMPQGVRHSALSSTHEPLSGTCWGTSNAAALFSSQRRGHAREPEQ